MKKNIFTILCIFSSFIFASDIKTVSYEAAMFLQAAFYEKALVVDFIDEEGEVLEEIYQDFVKALSEHSAAKLYYSNDLKDFFKKENISPEQLYFEENAKVIKKLTQLGIGAVLLGRLKEKSIIELQIIDAFSYRVIKTYEFAIDESYILDKKTIRDSVGSEFWLMFPVNYVDTRVNKLWIYLTGKQETWVDIKAEYLHFEKRVKVLPNQVTSVDISYLISAQYSKKIEKLGIYISTLQKEISVYGLNQKQYTTDAFLGLPVDILGQQYIIMSYPVSWSKNGGSQLGIVGVKDNTQVTIDYRSAAIENKYKEKVVVDLDAGYSYFRDINHEYADLTGTIITSDKPIAVFGGNRCTNIPKKVQACDYLIEQLPPVSTWGKSFVTAPLANRKKGDTFRILASEDNTEVMINNELVSSLNKAEYYEIILQQAAIISSNKPIMVAQFSNSSQYDGVTSDPFMLLIPPYEQFLADYIVTTPATGFKKNFINIVINKAYIDSFTIDDNPVKSKLFNPIADSHFYYAQIPVVAGSHNLSANAPFGAFMYGYADYDSYGYPGGLLLAETATVNHLKIYLPQSCIVKEKPICVQAEVLDQKGRGVPWVRIDFEVMGVNQVLGFELAGNGMAEFCYKSSGLGRDAIKASMGDLDVIEHVYWVEDIKDCK